MLFHHFIINECFNLKTFWHCVISVENWILVQMSVLLKIIRTAYIMHTIKRAGNVLAISIKIILQWKYFGTLIMVEVWSGLPQPPSLCLCTADGFS